MAANTSDRRWKLKGTAAVLTLVLVFLLPLTARAGTLTEALRATMAKVLTVLQDPHLKSEEGKNERYAQLLQVIGGRFDFREMAKRSLGSHWQGRTPVEQTDFVRLFTELIAGSYIEKLESYIGDEFVYLREIQEPDLAEVFTRIIRKNRSDFAVNYKLHSGSGDWKIYDVVIENVSLVNNYRAQFHRILTKESFDGLLKRLQESKGKEFGVQRLPPNALISYWIMSAAAAARRP